MDQNETRVHFMEARLGYTQLVVGCVAFAVSTKVADVVDDGAN